MSMFPVMTWKSTAVVSGATVLATWLASVPPSHAPVEAGAPARATAPAAAVSSDIEQQAARLHVKLRQEIAYSGPSRNPFRFSAPAPSATGATRVAAAGAVVEDAVPPAPPPMLIRLSGIASDKVGETDQRTAILSTPAGVVLAREGDDVAGLYKVVTIGEDTVQLIRLDDGSALRLDAR